MSLNALLLSLHVLPAITLPDAPLAARYEIVEALGNTDVYASMAIDPNVNWPVVALIDTAPLDENNVRPADLVLRRHDGWTWEREIIGTVPMVGGISDAPRSLRLAITPNGIAHVLVIEPHGAGSADDLLVHIEAQTSGPARTVLDQGNVTTPSMTINGAGEPIVAWIKIAHPDQTGELRIRQRFIGQWTAVNVGASARVARPTFAVQPLNTAASPELIYADINTGGQQVQWARINGAQVSSQPVANFATNSGDRLQWQYLATRVDGSAEIAMVIAQPAPFVGAPIPHRIERRVRASAGVSFLCDTTCTEDLPELSAQGISGNALAVASNGRRALSFVNLQQNFRVHRADPPREQPFAELMTQGFAKVHDVAYDTQGRLHVLALDFSNHRDLLLVRELPPWIDVRVPNALDPIGGMANAFAMRQLGDGSPVVYGRRGSSDGPGSVWLLENGVFIEHPLPAGVVVTAVALAVDDRDRVHIAFRNDQDGRAWYARLVNGQWQAEPVSAPQLPIADLSLGLALGGTPRLLWRSGIALQLAARVENAPWRLHAFGGGQPRRPQMVMVDQAHQTYVAWFDEAGQQMHVVSVFGDLATASASVTELDYPEPPEGWVDGATAHAIALSDVGQFSLAVTQTAEGLQRVAFMHFDSGVWRPLATEPSSFGLHVIDRIWLDMESLSARSPRLLWTELRNGNHQLFHAEARFGLSSWRVHDLGTLELPTANLDFTASHMAHIAHVRLGALHIARKLERADDTVPPTPPRINNGLAFCFCPLLHLGNCTRPEEDKVSGDGLNEADLTGVRERFQATAAGRYYVDLFTRYGLEIMRLTLADMNRAQLHLSTLSDLEPGLREFAAGNGGAFVLKPQMLASAREIWQGWAQAGSPELAAVIQFELARSNDLNDYANLTFDQWFQGLQPGPGAMLANGFE